MAKRKAKTIDFQGRDYAQVSERLRLFREDCPRGDIETSFLKDGDEVVFNAVAIKDKGDPTSARATGHSLGTLKGRKDFEKLETIAVGRALAMLGYAASGEIASSEEMEEFERYQAEQKEKATETVIKAIKKAKDIRELRQIFLSSGYATEDAVIEAKDKRKAELGEQDERA